jgi:hypothetical protein
MAGLTCARRLADAGWAVALFDKSRGLGGRLATRRVEEGVTFDHGAQFVTARGAGFRSLLDDLAARGAAARWRPRTAGPTAGSSKDWWVGTPGMAHLARPLAEDLDVQTGAWVVEFEGEAGSWVLRLGDGSRAGPFERVALAIPHAQAVDLLSWSVHYDDLRAVKVAACWSAMVAFAEPLGCDFDVWQGEEGPLATASRNGSKPGRPERPECWVLHGGPGWSDAHLETAPDVVLSDILDGFRAVVGHLPDPVHAAAHRWRYARTLTPLGRPFCGGPTLFVGGDWCLGAYVEAAYDSGVAMADAIEAS